MNTLLQPIPPAFKDHSYQFSIHVKSSASQVWEWLNNTETFTKTQVWPYRVEFYSPDPEKIPNGFHVGVHTNHTGPLINFAGKLTAIEKDYRDLQYYYGSYAFSFKWIRPYRLKFWTEEDVKGTKLICKTSSYVKPGFIYSAWSKAQGLFWSRFKRWAKKSI